MTHERETYISWLVMLGALLDQARRFGLLSIDTDVLKWTPKSRQQFKLYASVKR